MKVLQLVGRFIDKGTDPNNSEDASLALETSSETARLLQISGTKNWKDRLELFVKSELEEILVS